MGGSAFLKAEGIGKPVDMTKESSRLEADGMAADSLSDVLEKMSSAVDRTTERTREIAAATREQAQATESVSKNIEQIAQM